MSWLKNIFKKACLREVWCHVSKKQNIQLWQEFLTTNTMCAAVWRWRLNTNTVTTSHKIHPFLSYSRYIPFLPLIINLVHKVAKLVSLTLLIHWVLFIPIELAWSEYILQNNMAHSKRDTPIPLSVKPIPVLSL